MCFLLACPLAYRWWCVCFKNSSQRFSWQPLFPCLPQRLLGIRCGAGAAAALRSLHESLILLFLPFVSTQCFQTIHIHHKNVPRRMSPGSTSNAFAFFISRIKIPATCAHDVGFPHSVETWFSILIFYQNSCKRDKYALALKGGCQLW